MSIDTLKTEVPDGSSPSANGDGVANGHCRLDEPFHVIATTAPVVPLDDRTIFSQLMAVAGNAGRPDLVEEFRRRAEGIAAAPNGPIAAFKAQKPDSTPRVMQPVTKSLVNEGLRLIREKKLKEAVEKLREAIRLEPEQHDAHGNLGVALARLGRVAEAEASFREAVRLRPNAASMFANLGTACMHQKKLAEAEEAFRQALRLEPNNADFHKHLGTALEALKQLAPAEAEYRAAIAAKRGNPEFHFLLGKLLEKTKKPADAEACFREATRIKPDQAAYWISLGGTLEAQNQSAAAESAYRVALGLDPKNPETHNNLGVSLASQYRVTEAEASYRQALVLAPGLAMAHNNLGNSLRTQGRLDEATASLREAIRLKPRYAEAHNNLGIVFIQQRLTAEGMACYDEALRLRPNYPEAHLNRALQWLAAADFERGWAEYEWRFRLKNRKIPGKTPRWDGSPLDGRRLLLHAEQGLGDTVQFMRYAALIPRGSGGTVAIECQEPLVEVARSCPGIDRVIPRGKPITDVDVSAPLLSVPGILGTTSRTIPGQGHYITPDPARVAFWRTQLDMIPGRRIGIAWQGSQEHKGDKMRSMSLARFAGLAKVNGVSLCSLQKGFGSEQLTDGTADGVPVRDFGSLTKPSFADTAALIQALDLVVTVDTAIAHVAGALAVPVWVMLPYASDWRWLSEREDTPWYPTMRLYRQTKIGDWTEVFTRMAFALEQWPDRLRFMPKR